MQLTTKLTNLTGDIIKCQHDILSYKRSAHRNKHASRYSCSKDNESAMHVWAAHWRYPASFNVASFNVRTSIVLHSRGMRSIINLMKSVRERERERDCSTDHQQLLFNSGNSTGNSTESYTGNVSCANCFTMKFDVSL